MKIYKDAISEAYLLLLFFKNNFLLHFLPLSTQAFYKRNIYNKIFYQKGKKKRTKLRIVKNPEKGKVQAVEV